jgi:conjugative transposon TraN protein
VQFLLKSVHSHNGLFYFHTETRNRSNVAFRTDFIRFKIVDKKVPKRTAIQERVIDPVRSYNEVLVTEGKSDVCTVYAIPDDKLLVIDLFEKDGGRHQTIRVENADLVAARQINELKIK